MRIGHGFGVGLFVSAGAAGRNSPLCLLVASPIGSALSDVPVGLRRHRAGNERSRSAPCRAGARTPRSSPPDAMATGRDCHGRHQPARGAVVVGRSRRRGEHRPRHDRIAHRQPSVARSGRSASEPLARSAPYRTGERWASAYRRHKRRGARQMPRCGAGSARRPWQARLRTLAGRPTRTGWPAPRSRWPTACGGSGARRQGAWPPKTGCGASRTAADMRCGGWTHCHAG